MLYFYSRNCLKEDFRIINPLKSVKFAKKASDFKESYEKQVGRQMSKPELYYKLLYDAVNYATDDSALLSNYDEVRFFHRRYNLARAFSFDKNLPKVNAKTTISELFRNQNVFNKGR